MRNWHPLLADTLRRRCTTPGSRRAVGFIAAAHHSYSSCQQYRENVAAARSRSCGRTPAATWTSRTWGAGSIIRSSSTSTRGTCVRRGSAAAGGSATRRGSSLPHTAFRGRWPTPRATRRSCTSHRGWWPRQRASRDWALVVSEPQRTARRIRGSNRTCATTCALSTRRGLQAAILCPIGFVCDHIEVLYDLDHEAAAVCRDARPADGPRRSGQRRSRVPRHDGRRRASHDSPLRLRPAVADPRTVAYGRVLRRGICDRAADPAGVTTITRRGSCHRVADPAVDIRSNRKCVRLHARYSCSSAWRPPLCLAQAPVSYRLSFPEAEHRLMQVEVQLRRAASRSARASHEPFVARPVRGARVREERVRRARHGCGRQRARRRPSEPASVERDRALRVASA